MGLGTYEIAARLCVDGQTRVPVSGRTLPLGPASRNAAELRQQVAEAHGLTRAEVEAGLLARRQPKQSARPTRLGELPTDGASA